jgi:ribA/ribD-fused uncharacterized protein
MTGKPTCVEYLITKKDTRCTATASWGIEGPTHCLKHANKEWKTRPDLYCFDEKKGGKSLANRLLEQGPKNSFASPPAFSGSSTDQKVQFHNTIAGKYQLFSTMATTPFVYTPDENSIEPRMWQTVEHAFNTVQYIIVPRDDEEEKILIQRITEIQNAPTPLKAKTIGRSTGPRTRSDWEYKDGNSFFATKHLFMFDIMKAKFDQNPEAKQLLMSTGNKDIEEITPTDTHWGIGKGTGKNYLGKILMALRNFYKEQN